MQLHEVPQTPKLRCPQDPSHREFVQAAKTSRKVDEMMRPIGHEAPGHVCATCGTPARIREQLNG